MKVSSCRFELSAFKPEDEPKAVGPQVIFLGRSNVGKSSLINRLLGAKSLARTSSTPGRTQSINFYRVNETYQFIDLPGYGYARVPEAVRQSWKPMVEGFLDRRCEQISLALLVIDARREPTEMDGLMKDWLESKAIPYVVAVTKTDKLSGNERAAAGRRVAEVFGSDDRTPLFVSAKSGLGIREVWKRIDRALEGSQSKGGRLIR